MSVCFTYLRELNLFSMMLRVILAMVVGGIIGFEREKKGRPAGFRTYMLVAVGATLTVILSQYLDYMLNTRWALTANSIGIKTSGRDSFAFQSMTMPMSFSGRKPSRERTPDKPPA